MPSGQLLITFTQLFTIQLVESVAGVWTLLNNSVHNLTVVIVILAYDTRLVIEIAFTITLASTIDDADMAISHVVRGADLLFATDIHRLLQALMGWPDPRYAHHALLTDASGRRLAKRDRAATIRDLRASGASAAEVLRRAGA